MRALHAPALPGPRGGASRLEADSHSRRAPVLRNVPSGRYARMRLRGTAPEQIAAQTVFLGRLAAGGGGGVRTAGDLIILDEMNYLLSPACRHEYETVFPIRLAG